MEVVDDPCRVRGVLGYCLLYTSFTNQVAVLSSIGYEGIIGADFSQMLTTAGDVSMYDIARGVWDAAVLPIGCGVLGLVFTVKLIQISQRMDGNASFPGVKEVVFPVSYTHLDVYKRQRFIWAISSGLVLNRS